MFIIGSVTGFVFFTQLSVGKREIIMLTVPVIPVDPAILSASDIPWEDLGNGMKRKVFFNDRLTFVILEINRPAEKDGEIVLHSHPHDQISYVLEGKNKGKRLERKKR